MRWSATLESTQLRHYEIEYDPVVGFYLYVYEEGKCIRDHLQDALELAIDFAFEDYGMPKNAWKKTKE